VAQDRLRELAALSRDQNFPFFAASADLQRATLLCAQEAPEEGRALAHRACADGALASRTSGQTARNLLLAACCMSAGRVDEALSLAAQALEKAETTGERFVEAELHRLIGRGLLAQHPKRQDQAEACFQRALAVARGQEVRLYELRAATDLARLWSDQGRRPVARAVLTPIHGWFTEGLDAPDLRAAKTLLDRL
jgi:predicted ATPase